MRNWAKNVAKRSCRCNEADEAFAEAHRSWIYGWIKEGEAAVPAFAAAKGTK
jgi:hypothetical protein